MSKGSRNRSKKVKMEIHNEDYIPLNQFDSEQIEGVRTDPNRKIIKEPLHSFMRGNYSKYPPHIHNDYKEEFWGGFKTLHREHFFYNLGLGDGSPFEMITGNITKHKEREIKDIEYTLKKHEGSAVHFEGTGNYSLFEEGVIFVFTWSSYDNCFLLFKHTPNIRRPTESTTSDVDKWLGYSFIKE